MYNGCRGGGSEIQYNIWTCSIYKRIYKYKDIRSVANLGYGSCKLVFLYSMI